ncbi:putative filamentous hemagglutinin [Rhodobacteraceae bacterium KLH11]|nr:putative filamentous hemagglutinin [Rhodobacteraceae bacterium KLH11]
MFYKGIPMRKRFLEKAVSSVLTFALTVQPALLHAQNIQPANPSPGPRPHVDQSLNGTTVVNISTPNGAGVSHDVYTAFEAGDLILNNSAEITNTQLGGVIEGNGNLRPGREADLWIGEVVGGSQTQLNGILEVAGPQMDVVLANEFGITCNGCGFLNTGRATLTTGTPQFGGNGALTGFDVRRGTVTIGADGLNPESRLALTDTSRVDVIARAAAIYGAMRADQLNVVAGANQVDYNWSYDPETGAVTGITAQAGEGTAPALAVDVAALGGMYANAIRLIATENGVGVRLNGNMASSTNIALRADGQLTLGAPSGGPAPQIRAGGRVQVRNQGPILLDGAITSESGDLIDIRTGNGDLTFNGQAAGGAIRLESAGMLNISGAIVAREAFAAASTTSSVALDGTSEVFARSIDVDALTQLSFEGRAAALEAAALTAGTELATGASSELVAESVAFIGDDARIEGQAQALDELTIEATDGSVTHTGSSRGQFVTITGDAVQTGTGSQIAAVEDLSVTAQDQAVIDGDLVAGQQANLLVTAGDLSLQGRINAGNTDVTASGQTSLGADALAVGHSVLELRSGALNGGLTVSHFSQLRAGDGLAVTLDTGGLSVAASERVEFDGDLLLDLGGDLENRGTIKASGDLQLRSGADLNNRGGLLKSGDAMQLVARNGTVLNQSGRIEADGGLAIEGQEVINEFTAVSVETSDSIARIEGETTVEITRETNTIGTIVIGTEVRPVSETVIADDPSELPPRSCSDRTRLQFIRNGASTCGGVLDGIPEGSGTVTWTQGQAVTANSARPEILSGAGIAISADVVHNDAGLFSSAAGTEIQSRQFANTSIEDTQTSFQSTYSIRFRDEVNNSGVIDRIIRETTVDVGAPEIIRRPDPEASLTGEILAGAGININGSTVHSDGNIRAGTSSVLLPQENAAVTESPLPALVIPTTSLTPVQPDLPELANLDTLIGEGRTSLGTTPVSFEDFFSSDYFLDRLQIQNELFQNINRPAEWNGYPSDGTPYEGGPAVQAPGPGFTGFGDRFGLSETGLVAALDKANASTSGDLTIIAGDIAGAGGSLVAENGALSLTSFGDITFESTELGADLIDIITGGDFSGKALVIRSSSDTSIFAAGNVTIEGLKQTRENYTQTSTTRITSNIASRFDVGGDLSVISSSDLSMAGVEAQVAGDTRLTARGSLYLLAEDRRVQYNEGDRRNGKDRLSIKSQVTRLSTGGDFIANAGGDAVLIGTQINAGGSAHLAAAGDVVLAAAQDIKQSEKRKTSSGFLSKKKETRSTLAVTNRGVGITAGGDIDVIAETGDLTTAGTEFASASGDINLAATEGNILAGTYTDVFEKTHVKEKSYLGGLLSRSSQLHTVDHINTGTDALAALDLSIVSGTDTTLVGATLSAGQNLNITTGGDFSVQAAIDSHRSEFFESDLGLVTLTTVQESSFAETARLTELLAGQGMSFDIGGDAELVLYQTAGVDAPNPQDLYPEELLAIDGLDLISRDLADEYFYDKQTQLSPAFKALVAIAVAAYAPALVAQIGNVAAGAAAGTTTTSIAGITTATTTTATGAIHLTAVGQGLSAAISSATVSTLDGVVSGNLDLGEILETAAFSGVSAGLTSGLNLDDIVGKIPESSPLNDALLGNFGNGSLTIAGVLEGTIDGAISSGLSSAVYGTDFSDSFTAGLASTLANLAAADAQNVVGATFEAGSTGNILSHSFLGCLKAEATGADCASGIAGALSEQAYVASIGGTIPQIGTDEYLAWKGQHSQNIELIGAAVGFVFSGGEAENVNAASSYAVSAFQNNYLTSAQRAEVERLLAEKNELLGGECQFDASRCEAIEQRLSELELESALNTLDLEQACKSSLTSAACTAYVNEARNYIEWTDINGHRFDVNIGQFYHPGLLGKGKAGLDQSIIQAIEEKPQVTSLDDLRDTVHQLNRAGLFTGYFGEAGDLKHQGQLMDEFGRLNDTNDPLVEIPCAGPNVANACYKNRRAEIRKELAGYGIKDFFVPRTIGGVIFEVGTAGAGTLVKLGGKTFLRVGDELLEATADGAGGYKVAPNKTIGSKAAEKVTWVDENASMSARARSYDDGATGSRSNVETRQGQAPSLTRTTSDGKTVSVRFDGVDGDVLVDRKLSVVTTPKAKNQVLRQSEALEQNGLTARWEVPTQAQANRATRVFEELGIENITVKVVPE